MGLYSQRSVLPLGTSKALTRCSLIRSQRLSSVLPASLLRFVIITTGVSEGEITLAVQLLKDQNKYDQIPLSVFDRLRRVLPLADKVMDDIVCEETDTLEEIILRMFRVMHRVAEYSCDYVRRGRLGRQIAFSRFSILMTAARMVDQGAIEEIEGDLTKVIDDFNHAVNVEALRRIKATGEPFSYPIWP